MINLVLIRVVQILKAPRPSRAKNLKKNLEQAEPALRFTKPGVILRAWLEGYYVLHHANKNALWLNLPWSFMNGEINWGYTKN